MSKERKAGHLKIVSSFSSASHPYSHTEDLKTPYDGTEIVHTETRLRQALYIASVDDYKLFKSTHDVSIHMRTVEEFERVSVALRPDQPYEEPFLTAPEGYALRKLKKRRTSLQEIIDSTELKGRVSLGIDRKQKSIVVVADDKYAYLGFRAMMEKNDPSFILRPLTAAPSGL